MATWNQCSCAGRYKSIYRKKTTLESTYFFSHNEKRQLLWATASSKNDNGRSDMPLYWLVRALSLCWSLKNQTITSTYCILEHEYSMPDSIMKSNKMTMQSEYLAKDLGLTKLNFWLVFYHFGNILGSLWLTCQSLLLAFSPTEQWKIRTDQRSGRLCFPAKHKQVDFFSHSSGDVIALCS